MEIILPEQNYSLDELNSTIHSAVKGYIENIRLLKIANMDTHYYGKGYKITAPFPMSNHFKFDWKWNKDFHNSRRTIKTGDDLTLKLDIRLHKRLKGLSLGLNIQVSISATKVRKSKKNNQLGYVFKSISKIYSSDYFIARIQTRLGVYSARFLTTTSFDKSKIYSYEDTQVQHGKYPYKSNMLYSAYYFPKGQMKSINVSEDTKLGFPKDAPMYIIPMDSISPAFKSFIKKMKRN